MIKTFHDNFKYQIYEKIQNTYLMKLSLDKICPLLGRETHVLVLLVADTLLICDLA